MGNLGRALQLALRHRFILVGALVASLGVALLWGANIGTVYPFVEVVFRGQSIPGWVAEQREQAAAEREAAAATPPEELTPAQTAQLEAWVQTDAFLADIQPTVDAWLPQTPFGTLVVLVTLLLLGTAIKNLLLVGNLIWVERLGELAALDLRRQLYRQALAQDVAQFRAEGSAPWVSRLTHDMAAVRTGITTLLGQSIREPLKMIVCLAGAALICWPLLLVSLIVTPVAILLMRMLATSIKRASRRAMEEMSSLYTVLDDSLGAVDTVQAYRLERQQRRRFYQSSKQYFFRYMRIVLYNALTKPVTELMGIGIICLAMLAGAYLVLNQETHLLGIPMSREPLSLPALMAFYALLAGAADPVRKLSEVYSFVQRGAAAADRIYELIDAEPKVQSRPNPRPIPDDWQEIHFDEIEFAYLPEQPVLQGLSLTIQRGETIAVIGPNGCGKSTLANLLIRFYDPDQGSVRLGGVDLRDCALPDLRDRMALVAQRTRLLDETVRENIRSGRIDASDEEVVAAARQAGADRFIRENLEDGYDTLLDGQGNRLSGGQRQRISLARAILRDPQIMILDEATSQVDLESEQLIHRALEPVLRERTAVMITHRLASLHLADRIVVIDQGRIVSVGTHADLIASCGLYQRLHESQAA